MSFILSPLSLFLIALAIFVFTTIWLTGKKGSEPTVYYSMYFETDVSGLMIGGPVFYLGVEVGTVRAMTIIPGDPMQIRVDAEVLQAAPIDSGTYASLALQGITGVAVIRLSADPGVHPGLEKEAVGDDRGDANLVIRVRDTGFSALLSKAPGIVEKLDLALFQINQILGEENQQSISLILADLATVSSTLAARKEVIGEIPVSLNNAMKELHASLITIKSMAGDFEPELLTAMANISQLTDDLANVSARLEEWTALSDADMNAFMQDGLGQIPDLVSDARNTLREIEKLAKELREDPSALIYQPRQDSVDVD